MKKCQGIRKKEEKPSQHAHWHYDSNGNVLFLPFLKRLRFFYYLI